MKAGWKAGAGGGAGERSELRGGGDPRNITFNIRIAPTQARLHHSAWITTRAWIGGKKLENSGNLLRRPSRCCCLNKKDRIKNQEREKSRTWKINALKSAPQAFLLTTCTFYIFCSVILLMENLLGAICHLAFFSTYNNIVYTFARDISLRSSSLLSFFIFFNLKWTFSRILTILFLSDLIYIYITNKT